MLDHLLLKHFRFRCDWDMSQIVGMSTAVFTTDEHRYFGVVMISQMMFRRRKRLTLLMLIQNCASLTILCAPPSHSYKRPRPR
jgi:hypothetical protein